MSTGIEGGWHTRSASRSDGEGQVLVEHLHVIAGVLLRGEGVDLAANGVHLLGDAFSGAASRALEQHVLDEVRDARMRLGLVPRATSQPDADADGTHVRHSLGDETDTVGEYVAANTGLGHC